jgi:hypothetical protein
LSYGTVALAFTGNKNVCKFKFALLALPPVIVG